MNDPEPFANLMGKTDDLLLTNPMYVDHHLDGQQPDNL